AKAIVLLREAVADFGAATREAPRRKLAVEVEKLRSEVLPARRDQAMKAEAATLARDIFEAAREKELEGDRLVTGGDHQAALRSYQDGAAQYEDAGGRAGVIAAARAEARNERGRMEEQKGRASRTSPQFADAQRLEQEGIAMSDGLRFREA